MNIRVNYKIKKIQELRAIHAMSEAGISIVVPENQKEKFSLLREKFKMDFIVDDKKQGTDLSAILYIDHETPETGIGFIKQPLIFPKAITSYCKTLWQDERKYKFTFAGLITRSRHDLIAQWIKSNITSKPFKLPVTDSFFNKKRSKIYSFFNIDSTVSKTIDDLIIWSSNRGRKFPIKSWDDDYFKVLGDSEFVLCPSGVFTWSYRFFESVLCGAIPIVEADCKAYEGFRFKYFSDDSSTFVWSKEDAEHNYRLCIQKITVPAESIKEAVMKQAN